MTDEQINTAIAEACGWRKEDGVWMWTRDGIDCTSPELWEWHKSFNAILDAVSYLKGKQRLKYEQIINSMKIECTTHTVRQRAEAFLRATERWKEEAK